MLYYKGNALVWLELSWREKLTPQAHVHDKGNNISELTSGKIDENKIWMTFTYMAHE